MWREKHIVSLQWSARDLQQRMPRSRTVGALHYSLLNKKCKFGRRDLSLLTWGMEEQIFPALDPIEHAEEGSTVHISPYIDVSILNYFSSASSEKESSNTYSHTFSIICSRTSTWILSNIYLLIFTARRFSKSIFSVQYMISNMLSSGTE